MTMKDIGKYFDFETKVKVITKDNAENIGIITGVVNGFDTSSGKDEIELDMDTHYLGIEISDIKAIETLSETAQK